jgi:nucleoside-diphosphate-sugar epimerase
MKVLVIGATGQTGRRAVMQLLARGHEVTAFARNPSAVTQSSDRLRVVQGDARDPESIDLAMHGQDAVLSAFGPRSPKKDDVQEVLMRNLIAAMTKHGITRLVNLSVWGSGRAAVPPVNPIARYFVFPVVLRHILADKRRGEACLFDSALMYVNVCPGRLKNAPARGGVRASTDGKGLKQYMHREDLAAFMVGQLTEDTWVRKCVAIGY